MRYRLTPRADEDLEDIPRFIRASLGARQVEVYGELIERALQRLGRDPLAPGSKLLEDAPAGTRSYHVGLAASRRRAARHVICHRVVDDEIVVEGILHDSMDPALHLPRAR